MNNKQKEMCIVIITQTTYNLRYHKGQRFKVLIIFILPSIKGCQSYICILQRYQNQNTSGWE